ncbi:MAG: HEAT repeat domain-containing protein, partial [Acidobacteriota bacterium]|nr:HEAT repeat domain-containing protein [Acidobacteriota bacterium]
GENCRYVVIMGSPSPANRPVPLTIDLSDSGLTPEEAAARQSIRSILQQFRDGAARTALAELAESHPAAFFHAGLSLLLSDGIPPFVHRRSPLLIERREFLAGLADPSLLRWPEAAEICRRLMVLDPWLDLRLARLAPARDEQSLELATSSILRLLDILQEISTGPRLIAVLGHLVSHSHPQVASKAALFLGRRIHNPSWSDRLNRASDSRLRANAIESLWGRHAPWARNLLVNAVADDNNRVAGNALVGLHLLGVPEFPRLATAMLADPRPAFRQTAAWVMGRTGDPEFLGPLQQAAAADPAPAVRGAALRALVKIRKAAAPEPAVEPAPVPVPVPVADAAPQPPPEAAPALPEPPAPPAEGPLLHLDGSFVSG